MDNVVDLTTWRDARGDDATLDPGIRRLELAVAKLDAAASSKLDRGRGLAPAVETELLAILGAITADLVEEAADRAEHLAAKLRGRRGPAGGSSTHPGLRVVP